LFFFVFASCNCFFLASNTFCSIKIDNTYTVKFLSRKDARGNTFIWPTKDDLQTIDEKFIIFYDFEILPSPGLTHWIIPEMDDLHQQFVIIDK
jgi:hypothetical protein